MEYLLSHGYKTLRFDDLADPKALSFASKKILIAFDDGWKSNYSLIFDWMKERGIKYNVFLTIGEIGTNPDYLNWNQVREMHGSGICGFGVHTFSHPDMSEVSKVDTAMEIDKANEVFKKELGFSPHDFCYPYGYCSESSHQWLIVHTDYLRIYTSAPFYSYVQDGRIIFSRQGISNDDSARNFRNKVKGYLNVYQPFFERYYKIFR
jgi:peptidoglycan/xylan/chitin deacetylase (PgdA/CDA1 family)